LATWLLLPFPLFLYMNHLKFSAFLPTSALTPLGHPHTLSVLKLRDRDRTTRDVIGEIVPSSRDPTLKTKDRIVHLPRWASDVGIPQSDAGVRTAWNALNSQIAVTPVAFPGRVHHARKRRKN
jgi:hypothetical protein